MDKWNRKLHTLHKSYIISLIKRKIKYALLNTFYCVYWLPSLIHGKKSKQSAHLTVPCRTWSVTSRSSSVVYGILCKTLNLIMDRDEVKSWLCVSTSAQPNPWREIKCGLLHPTVCSVPMQPDHGDRSSGNGKRFSLAKLKATILKVVAENFSSIYAGASLEATERIRMCGALDSTVCKQSAQPDECLLHLVECRVTLREIKWFLLCMECTCTLTHEDGPRSSLNGKRLSLTNLKKISR